jgi:high frequency lysogenization protein
MRRSNGDATTRFREQCGMMHERVLALAGLVQGLKQVRRIAETGQADASVLATALDSVFRIDAEAPAAIYGTVADLRPGLLLLRDYFGNQNKDEALPRLALAVLQIERRFVRDGAMVQQVQDGIAATAPLAERLGSSHPDVLAALGKLYADTVSNLRPKVMVQGNPHYLGQADIVSEIRALLLAALRSAVLWRQMGGSLFDFLLGRRQMLAAIESALA